jgi:cation diffusion facilitator family transporter
MLAFSILQAVWKTGTGLAAGSLAVLGAAIDSGLDLLTTLVALILARVASRGPDDRHPYGHAKFETLGALAMVAFLSVSVFELLHGAVRRLAAGGTGSEVATGFGIAVMSVSLVVGWAGAAYERRRGEELRSDLLLADAAHLRADVNVTLAVIAGLVATRLGLPNGDAWTTLLVCVLIARTGWEIVAGAIPVLVDERAADPEEISRMARETDGVHAVYDVRSRGRGDDVFAELTIAVRGGMDVARAHEIADAVEHAVAQRLGARAVVVHVEPVRPGDGAETPA